MKELLLGDEAVALAALDSGITGAFSYPGTPATEIMECLQIRAADRPDVTALWSANEKVAYEQALGMSYVGRRVLVSMKHVGLNVAADPFMSSALTGACGGLVLAVADDPGMHSSQNEQDSRFYGDFAQIPMLEPANQQEAYDLTREAFSFSERVGLPVLVRLVTRLAHSRAVVERCTAPASQPAVTRPADPRNWTLLPPNARRRYQRVLDLQGELLQYSENSPYNSLALGGPKGVIACGLGYNYVREALGGNVSRSILKIATYPVPMALIRRLVDHCDDILLVEDGYPFIEKRLTGIFGIPGKAIHGKTTGALPAQGELSAESVRAALGASKIESATAPIPVPIRPPVLCDGCPHCDTFRALMDAVPAVEKPYLFSDIGCYTLGAAPPYHAVHTCVDMGASISMAHGAARAGAHPVICTIGDSTFTHSGMPPLLGAAHDDANMTVIILDNATVGMTGGQEGLVTGEDFLRLLRGLGVDPRHLVHVEPTPKTHAENVTLIRREVAHHGLSVIVATRPCIHVKRRAVGRQCAGPEPASNRGF